MSLDYSAVPRMPDGRTAAEHILTIERTASEVVRVPMGPRSAGGTGRMTWHVWDEGTNKPILLLFHGGSGSWIHWIRNVQPLSKHFAGRPVKVLADHFFVEVFKVIELNGVRGPFRWLNPVKHQASNPTRKLTVGKGRPLAKDPPHIGLPGVPGLWINVWSGCPATNVCKRSVQFGQG